MVGGLWRRCLTPPLARSPPQVEGTTERPRLAVFRSNNHIYAQVIDDTDGHTLAAASTLTPEIREALGGAGCNEEAAKLVGTKIAELCKQKNIEMVGAGGGGWAGGGGRVVEWWRAAESDGVVEGGRGGGEACACQALRKLLGSLPLFA